MQDDKDRVNASTTVNFDGFISLVDPKKSWVAKWCRVDALTQGCYAIKVHGDLPPEIEDILQDIDARNIGKLSQQEH